MSPRAALPVLEISISVLANRSVAHLHLRRAQSAPFVRIVCHANLDALPARLWLAAHGTAAFGDVARCPLALQPALCHLIDHVLCGRAGYDRRSLMCRVEAPTRQ